MSLTPVRNSSAVSLTPVKLSKTVKVLLTGVVDTSEEFLTGINDTGEANKLSNNSIKIREKIEIVPRHVYWDQEEPFHEKNRRTKIS